MTSQSYVQNDTGKGISDPLFACYPKGRFIANLANLKEVLRVERERVVQEWNQFL